MCLGVWAAAGYTVEQIKQFIPSAIQLKNPDKEVAETLRKMKLSERLDLDTVETLQSEGAGPKTVAVLKELATESASLPVAGPPPPKPVYVPPPPPSSEEQAKLLDEVRDYAVNYTQTLPDFICLEQTRRYVDTTGRESWRLRTSLRRGSAISTRRKITSWFRRTIRWSPTVLHLGGRRLVDGRFRHGHAGHLRPSKPCQLRVGAMDHAARRAGRTSFLPRAAGVQPVYHRVRGRDKDDSRESRWAIMDRSSWIKS